jgi:cephalosporin hydroxylase/SAM-dependent methyltransferase
MESRNESEELAGELGRPGSEPAADRLARATRRYLDLLRDSLLDLQYQENELRIKYLLECIDAGDDVDPRKLSNPRRYMAPALRRLTQQRQAGELPSDRTDTNSEAEVLAYASLGRVRLEHLERCLELIRAERVEGDLVDAGTDRGGAAIFMHGFLEAHELRARRVWVLDRFDGGIHDEVARRFPPDLDMVREAFARFGLFDDRVMFVQGPPSQALDTVSTGQIALLRVGFHTADDVRAALEELYDRVSPGGFVVVDRYGATDCQAVVDEFRSRLGAADPLERIDWSGAAWRKTGRSRGRRSRPSADGARRVAIGPARAVATKELAVVVVVHNMQREARRTLHSVSRGYQRGIDGLRYEVIVVENGSDPAQRLGDEFVRSFGPEFRYIDLGDDATPSPAGAINRGIAASSAPNLALMIDGAHVLTPGVLRFGMLALTTYAPAIATAKQWYVGPGQQPQMVAGGYDRRYEDRLFAAIRWPSDGYRLFEVGHFVGDRDWFDGEWESNCIFVPRHLLEQVGAMDESFSEPGGGLVNLDFFERMAGTPGVTLVTMLGEGSFHQVHGGTTTNRVDPHELLKTYNDQYEELRGRRFRVPPQRTHYIGHLPLGARRSKPRRMTTFQHFRRAHVEASDTRPSHPVPMPQDLRTEFIDAFWRSGVWHQATWLGNCVHRSPTDLFVYQELIFRLRPEWIVETRTGAGGRALFLASICELIASGRVLSIDGYGLTDPPEHQRITYLRGDPAAPETAAQARKILGEQPRALVILGGGSGAQVLAAFRNYAPFVPVGSYVVVEDTVLQGNPVWSDFGAGPAAAVYEIVEEPEFVQDYSLERFGLTFNAGGFLKRVR